MTKIFVFGSINMDMVATVKNFPKPGETISGKTFNTYPGGKGANQAVAAGKLGANAIMLGCLGDDTSGIELEKFIGTQNVETKYIEKTNKASTGTAIITVDSSAENAIIVISGANGYAKFEKKHETLIDHGDIVCCQFEVPINEIELCFRGAKKRGALTVLNPAPFFDIPQSLLELVDYLIVNETEFEELTKCKIPDSTIKLKNVLKSYVNSSNLKALVLTLGGSGLIGVEASGGKTVKVDVEQVAAIDTTGAGDCFVGAFTAALASKKSFSKTLRFANVAAAISVTRMGAGSSMPTIEEVEGFINGKEV